METQHTWKIKKIKKTRPNHIIYCFPPTYCFCCVYNSKFFKVFRDIFNFNKKLGVKIFNVQPQNSLVSYPPAQVRV